MVKKLNRRGMTLVEVVAAMAMLAILSLGIYQGASLILRGYELGGFLYESSRANVNALESGLVPGTSGTVTFQAGASLVTVEGNYHTATETGVGKEASLTLFRPGGTP